MLTAVGLTSVYLNFMLTETYDACLIKEKLKAVVPEYEMQDTECVF